MFGPRHLKTAACLLAAALPALALAETDPAIAEVGSVKVTWSQLQRRMATIPPWQLTAMGKTPEARARRVLEDFIVRELLLNAGVAERKVAEEPAVRAQIQGVLRDALTESLIAEVRGAPDFDKRVKAAYDAAPARFHEPEQLLLWRIVVRDEATAKEVLAAAEGKGGVERWDHLAREKSLDKATSERHGELGFVGPDGQTSVPTVRVPAELYQAAEDVSDGELVSEPLKLGDQWMVLWRRGTRPAKDVSFSEAKEALALEVAEREASARLQTLVAGLRAQHLKLVAPDLVGQLPSSPP